MGCRVRKGRSSTKAEQWKTYNSKNLQHNDGYNDDDGNDTGSYPPTDAFHDEVSSLGGGSYKDEIISISGGSDNGKNNGISSRTNSKNNDIQGGTEFRNFYAARN